MDMGFHRRALHAQQETAAQDRGSDVNRVAAFRSLLAANAARTAASPTVRATLDRLVAAPLTPLDARITLFSAEKSACEGPFSADLVIGAER
jgi:hypothetical protein